METKAGFRSRHRLRAEVTVSRLESAKTYGSGDCQVGDVAAGKFRCETYGSGDVRVSGSAREVVLRIYGSGDADLSRLTAREASVRILGSGDVAGHADRKLSTTIFGSGDVVCVGRPTERKKRIFGSGDIRYR